MMPTEIQGPQRIAVQLDDSLGAEFYSYWLSYDKPCPLTFQATKTPGLIAICFTVDPRDYRTMEFMQRAVSKTGGKIWNITKKK